MLQLLSQRDVAHSQSAPLQSGNAPDCRSQPERNFLVNAIVVDTGSFMDHSRPLDEQEILEHIRSIFRAFIRRDRQTIRDAHASDWVGFLGPSTGIERGLDAYMVNADKSLRSFTGTGFEILDTEFRFFADVAIVYYVARYDYTDSDANSHTIPLRSVDIYERRDGHWIQTGSHIAVVPSSGKWGEGD